MIEELFCKATVLFLRSNSIHIAKCCMLAKADYVSHTFTSNVAFRTYKIMALDLFTILKHRFDNVNKIFKNFQRQCLSSISYSCRSIDELQWRR